MLIEKILKDSLEKGEETENNVLISVLKSQENLLDLIRHSVANRIFKETTQKENLFQCVQLVNNVNVRRLEIFHSFDTIQDMILVIEGDVGV